MNDDNQDPVYILRDELLQMSRAFHYICDKSFEAYNGKQRMTKDEWFSLISCCAAGQDSIKAIVKAFTPPSPK